MIRLTLAALVVTFALPALADGPAPILEEPEVIAPEPNPNLLPLLLGIVVLGLVMSGGGDDDAQPGKPTQPEKPNCVAGWDGGC